MSLGKSFIIHNIQTRVFLSMDTHIEEYFKYLFFSMHFHSMGIIVMTYHRHITEMEVLMFGGDM